jgi:hypothetical protein
MENFKEIMSNNSYQKLQEIINNKTNWQPEAVMAAENELHNRNIEIDNYNERGLNNLTEDEIEKIKRNTEYYSQDFIATIGNLININKESKTTKNEQKDSESSFNKAETRTFNKAAVPFYVIALLSAVAIIVLLNLKIKFSILFGILGIILFFIIGLLIAKYKSETILKIGLGIYVIDSIYSVIQIGFNLPLLFIRVLMINWIIQNLIGISKLYDSYNPYENSKVVKKPENQINVNQTLAGASTEIDDETKEAIRKMFIDEAYRFVREKFNLSLKDAKKIVKGIKSDNNNKISINQ